MSAQTGTQTHCIQPGEIACLHRLQASSIIPCPESVQVHAGYKSSLLPLDRLWGLCVVQDVQVVGFYQVTRSQIRPNTQEKEGEREGQADLISTLTRLTQLFQLTPPSLSFHRIKWASLEVTHSLGDRQQVAFTVFTFK